MIFLRTLGGLSLLDDEQRVLIAGQRRRLALLALLAVAGERGLFRDKIIAFLWPESPTENARHALHQLLYYLRRAAHPHLFVGTDPLRLNPEVVTSDVGAFSSARAAGSLAAAAALYTGSFLDGFFVNDAPEFESWVEQQRARLHVEFTSTLHRLAVSADEREAHSDAVERWRVFANAEPLDARATLGLMRALVAAGDPIGALREASVYENRLQTEVGQTSAPEIVAYVTDLRAAGTVTGARNEEGAGPLLHAAEPPAESPNATRGALAPRWSETKIFAIAVATVTVTLLIIGGYTAVSRRAAIKGDARVAAAVPVGAAAGPAIAVMPFGVHDSALQTWGTGALVALAASIDGTAGLRAIDPQAIRAALRAVSDTLPRQNAMLTVARRMGARYGLAGSIIANGSTVRIHADLYEAGRGRRLRQFQVEGHSARMFALLDELAVEAVEVLLKHEGVAGHAARVKTASSATASLPALKAYLEGEELYQRSQFKEAAEAYQRALDSDSTFALMFGRLLVPYSFVSEATPPSIRDPLAHALRFLDRLPRRDQLLVRASHLLARKQIPEAFELLRKASREYPDDYEIWYSLGEVALHESGVLLQPPEVAIRAFEYAVTLNPTFSGPYSHLIELTLGQRGDRARAAELNTTFERLAPEADNLEWGRLALALAFGDSSARARAIGVLDTLPLAVVMQLSKYFQQPHLYAAQERALATAAARAGDLAPEDHPFAISAYLVRGQLSAAAATALEYDGCAPRSIYWAHLLGKSKLSIDAGAALRAWHQSSLSCRAAAAFVAGGYAADQGRHAALDSARTLLTSLAAERIAAADTLAGRQSLYLAEALRGYALARSGNLQAGIRTLEAVQPHIANDNAIVRWWLGQLWLQAGDVRAARRYFASFWESSRSLTVSFELGRIAEELGRPAEARGHYLRFAQAWRAADRDVQPRVAEARARLVALRQAD